MRSPAKGVAGKPVRRFEPSYPRLYAVLAERKCTGFENRGLPYGQGRIGTSIRR